MTREIKWSDDWLKETDSNNDLIQDWGTISDEGKAYCKWCRKPFSVKAGLTNLKSHANGVAHGKISRSRKLSQPMPFPTTSQNTDADGSMIMETEIRCVTRTVLKSRSFESEDDFVDDLQALCPDSKIPKKMRLHSNKIAYLAKEALFPYVR